MTEFLMPKFGLTMTEGLLLEWHVETGAPFKAGGVLSEILVAAGEVASPKTDMQDSPLARKLMAEHGVQRTQVQATGRDGRVMKEDVLRLIATPLVGFKCPKYLMIVDDLPRNPSGKVLKRVLRDMII